jgi:quinol monooxygenase YgiN
MSIARRTILFAAPALVVGASLASVRGARAQAPAQGPEPRLVVTYVEAPAGAAAALWGSLETYVDRLRHAPEAPGVELLSEIGKPNRLVVVEHWAPGDPAAAERAGAALDAAVAGKVEAPIDRRLNRPLAALAAAAPADAFHMVMHVDVTPDGSAQAAQALLAQRTSVLAAKGAIGFDAGVQLDKPNHFAVHEVWASRAAYEAYAASSGGQNIRREAMRFRGAPFDDRFYTARRPA